MQMSQEMTEEMNLLLKFPLDSLMQGIKIHHDAEPSVVAASERLFAKGVISQIDGGYLTDLGRDLAEHAHMLCNALKSA